MIDYACNPRFPFSRTATETQPVGFITDLVLSASKVSLDKDVTVNLPSGGIAAYPPLTVSGGSANVVAVVEKVEWDGTPGGWMSWSCYLSGESLAKLRGLSVEQPSIEALGFCIMAFDSVRREWYGAFHPCLPLKVACRVNTSFGLDLHVDQVTTELSNTIGLYAANFSLVPSASAGAALMVASAANEKVEKSWGTGQQSGTVPASATTPLPIEPVPQ